MELTELVTNLGFPIAVAVFALWNSYKHEEYLQNVLSGVLKENTEALRELKQSISELPQIARGIENED